MSVSRQLRHQVRRYEPCLPRLAKEPPAGSGWIHEIKHDGFRILAELNAGDVKLITRKGFDLARSFPLATGGVQGENEGISRAPDYAVRSRRAGAGA